MSDRNSSRDSEKDGVDKDGFYERLLDSLYDGVYFVDTERRITYWNRAAARLTGFSASEVVGHFCYENILCHTDDEGHSLCEGGCPLLTTIETRKPGEREVFLRHRDGHRVPVLARSAPFLDEDGKASGAVEVFSDNSSHLAAAERLRELEQLAYIDPVTGLGNRRYADRTLKIRLSEFERYGSMFGFLILDVDLLKEVNDSHGHAAGDALLHMVGRTLVHSVRPFDLVARWGGDEFAGIFEHVTLEKLQIIADRCAALVRQSRLPLGQSGLNASVSIGGTVVRGGDTPQSILERADENLYRAKATGRGRACVA
jgi:diguanylate cyclase (GGDEF)-like protein/PAS domain S-box-containing protein